MELIRNEGLRTVDDIVQSVECLIMAWDGIQSWAPPHCHDYMELLYVLEGSYELKADSGIHRLNKNDLSVILPGEPHCTRRLGEKQTLLCIKFLPQILFSHEADDTMPEQLILLVLEHCSRQRNFSAEALTNTVIPQALAQIVTEYTTQGLGSALAIRSELSRILLWLVRYWHEQAGQPLLRLPNRSAMTALAHARKYVQDHYPTATLAGAAKACGLSYGYFSHIFNSCMKLSFSDYVNQARIAQAQRLLLRTNRSVTEIAMETGFSTASYFTQIFRRRCGVTPAQFRKNAAPDEASQENS